MKFIEFMGLPGSGKSSIRSKLVNNLKLLGGVQYLTTDEAFLNVSRKHSDSHIRFILKILSHKMAEKLVDKFMNRSQMQHYSQNRFLAQYGKALNIFLSSDIYDYMSVNERTNVIGSFIETGSIYESIKKYSDDNSMIFFEEGMIQKSFMFLPIDYIEDDVNVEVSNYLKYIPLPEYIVYVKLDVDECFKRMKKRPSGLTNRLKGLDDEVILSFLKRTYTHLECIARQLKKDNCTTVIEVDNSKNITESINDLSLLFSDCRRK